MNPKEMQKRLLSLKNTLENLSIEYLRSEKPNANVKADLKMARSYLTNAILRFEKGKKDNGHS